MTFLSPYVLPVAQVVWGVEIHSILMLFENQFLDTSSNFGAPKKQIDDCLHRSIFIYFCWLFLIFFSITLSATSFELADKVIEKSKKKYIEWHFCHHMYFLVARCLRCWNSFNSSCYLKINFLTPHPILS